MEAPREPPAKKHRPRPALDDAEPIDLRELLKDSVDLLPVVPPEESSGGEIAEADMSSDEQPKLEPLWKQSTGG